MEYVYPAIITPLGSNGFDASIPDLPYCRTCGKDLPEALFMAKDAVEMWLWDAENNSEPIPQASSVADTAKLCETAESFVSLIAADTDDYRRKHDTRAVKKTLTIPRWLNHQAEQANAPFSQILQQGLKEYLRID